MRLPRWLVWVLTVVYLLSFEGFLSAALFAYSHRGYVHGHVVLGIRLPSALAALAALLVMMAICAALSWLHFRRNAYTAFEENFLGGSAKVMPVTAAVMSLSDTPTTEAPAKATNRTNNRPVGPH